MRTRKTLSILLAIVLVLSLAPASFAASEGHWAGYGNDKWAYQFADGNWAYGWQDIDGARYFFDEEGWMITGWREIDGIWYYFDGSGAMITGWRQIDGSWYFFNKNGAMTTGWLQDSEKYYFDASGTMATSWRQISGQWYYFDGSGSMAIGWRQIDGNWYWFDANGVMATDWQTIDGARYYFTSDGLMATDWQKISGNWYYFSSAGTVCKGWQQINGNWYRFDANGVMFTGWKDLDSKTYYFGSDGVMVADRTVTIDNQKYSFRADGSLIVRSPVITKNPTDETVREGGSCWFVANHQGAQTACWHFVSPDGKTDLQYEKIGDLFPNLMVKNGHLDSMKLINIPFELNGWKVYCRYSNNNGTTDTAAATITVTSEKSEFDTAPTAGAPVITKNPTDETVREGGSCWFVANHQGAQTACWHFVSPDGKTDLQYEKIGDLFPNLTVKNGHLDSMKLINIPFELNCWKVYCRYSNNNGTTDTAAATITVTVTSK